MRTDNSDPLPYVQVDRAVKPKAALLADAIGVSRQHAIGSLIEWWDLCGDPRDLERILETTPEGEEPAVMIAAEDAATRFRLASGKDVELNVLVTCGLLEPSEGRYRVRGMSRYFQPIVNRVAKRKAASAGGKASAEARKAKYGTTKPFGGSSNPSSSTPEAEPEAAPKHARSTSSNDARSSAEAEPEAESNTAVSGQRSSLKNTAPEKPAPRETDLLCDDFTEATGKRYRWEGAKDAVALADLRKIATIEEIRARWRASLALPEKEFRACRSIADLRSKWNKLVDLAAPKPTQQHLRHL